MIQIAKRRLKSNTNLYPIQEEPELSARKYFVESPSKRYFKRVLNKDYQTARKINKKNAECSQQPLSKQFIRSSSRINKSAEFQKYNSTNHEVQPEESLNNFSLGLFKKSNNLNSSFIDSSDAGERKSSERKLDFSKIFIVAQQNTPYRQVIQLSLREQQNKQMLEKAVQQLQKRKLKKKFKMLKKNMKNDLQKRTQLDLSIQQLRSHKIGYKTFYKREILTSRDKLLDQQEKITRNYQFIEFPRHEVDKNQQKKGPLKESKSQKRSLSMNYQLKATQDQLYDANNIFVSNDKMQKVKSQGKSIKSDLTQKVNHIKDFLARNKKTMNFKQDRYQQEQIKSHKEINKSQVRLRKSTQGQKIIDNKKRQNLSLDRIPIKFRTQSQKKLSYSSKSVDKLPTLVKPLQVVMNNLRNSHNDFNPLKKKSKQIKERSQRCMSQVKLQHKVQEQNEQFPFLMTKQDLQNTLNRSRYEVKKLLCMHIQTRKKQLTKNKRRLLLEKCSEGKIYEREFMTSRKPIQNLKTIQQSQKEMQSTQYFNRIQSSVSLMPPPAHLLKIHTRELKKSVKSFVKKMKTSESPKKMLKKLPFIP